MIAAAFPTGTAPARPAWRGLMWIVSATPLWMVLIYWQPIITASGVSSTAARLMTYAIIAIGLWLGLERTDLTARQRRATWLTVMIPYTLWMAVAWSAAISGVFRPGVSPVPLLPMAIFLPVIVAAPILLLSRRMGELLDAMPSSWLVAVQAYRVFGSIFLVGSLLGVVPAVFGVPAGIGDVLTGLFAVPVAIALSTGTVESRRGAVIWNLFGLTDFAVAITLGLLTAPGPLQLIVTSVPSIGAGAYPNVLTPAFVVPSSILLHLLSLRQLRRRGNAELARG
jgi:hypothetical protein